MAEGAVSFLLDTMRDLLVERMDLIKGLKGELKQLQKAFEELRTFLHERQKGKDWRKLDREITILVYKADDIVDTFITRAVAEKSIRFSRFRFVDTFITRAVADKSIRFSRFRFSRRFSTDRVSDGLGSIIKGVRLVHGAAKSEEPGFELKRNPWLKEINTVGLEDEVATVIEYLNEESKECGVISIVGESGIGKTTLASKIYGDPTVKKKLTNLFWVTVSEEFSTKDLFISVCEDLGEKAIEKLTDSMMADIIRYRLDKSKFLIVVDGVHTIEDWRVVETALPKTNNLGKVLLTTHDERLARQANPKRDPHRMRSLELDESWKLFQLEMFGKLGECPPHLEMMANDIVRKCCGVPLAIIAIAGILRGKLSESEWLSTWNTLDTFLRENKEERMENMIERSYIKLPHHLRNCFLYLGMFPEDTDIPARRLVYLWITEGFIQKNPRKTLEEVAEDHLEGLINRNLVMVGKSKVEGGIKTCRISKTMRNFCKRKAENMFKEVTPGDFEIDKDCRRLCIHSDVVDFLRKSPHGEVVRSFLCSSKESTELPAECSLSIPEAFTLLRILEASPIKFLEFPRKLAQLIHLRYVALSSDGFTSLPKYVSEFWNLQTIIINTQSPTIQMEANIWKMRRLRHLKSKAAIFIINVAEGNAGENLQTLSRLAAECVTKDFCRRAFNLKKLGIRGQVNNLLERKCLSGLDRLQKLKLVHDVQDPLITLPPREAFPPNLMILEMSSTFLEWKQMDMLGELPMLEVLKLKENAFMGKKWIAVGDGFPYLEVLLIATTDLEDWTVSGDAFPALRKLVIRNCDKLAEIPRELKNREQVLEIDATVSDTKQMLQNANPGDREFQNPLSGIRFMSPLYPS